MIDVAVLPLFLLAVFILMITPGPDMMFITANSLAGGDMAGFASILGVATGACIHILGTAFGISAIFLASEIAFNLIRFAGVAFIGLAVRIFFTRRPT